MNWEQAVTWIVLIVVLYSVVSGKIRYDLTAFCGLLFLGILGLRSPSALFSGFSSPALFTIATVLVMSAGIVESGLLSGLGRTIAQKVNGQQNQALAVFGLCGFISAFMNNVGAIGIVLPTVKRMAQRAKVPHAEFGLPIAYASILGGSMTLIGTASNLIVSTYRYSAFGEPFHMFDFTLHGLVLLSSGVLVLFLCPLCGLQLKGKVSMPDKIPYSNDVREPMQDKFTRNRRKSLIVLFTLVPMIVLTGIGLIHPSAAYGMITLLWIYLGVLPYKTALKNINLPIILFLGSMFGISGILDETGALRAAVNLVRPVFVAMPPFLMIFVFLFVTALFANILDNSVSAVLMAPVSIALWKTGTVPFNPDALLMAVAAGASLGVVLPTHQATLVIMNSMEFPRGRFIITGSAIAVIAGIGSSFVIYTLWC